MRVYRKGRLYYWLIREFTRKYIVSFAIGICIGLFIGFVGFTSYPILTQRLFKPIMRIGVVGEYSPTTLPQDIQNKISLGLTSISEEQNPK